jgi:hypothetical protein
MASTTAVVIDDDPPSGRVEAVARGQCPPGDDRAASARTVIEKREPRPGVESCRSQTEQRGELRTIASPRPIPRPPAWWRGVAASCTNSSNTRAVGVGDPDTRVDDIDPHRVPAFGAEHDATGARIANGIRDEIANDALEQYRIGVDGESCPHRAQDEAIGDSLRSQVGCDAREQRLEREWRRRRMQCSGLQLRQVEKLREQSFECLDRRPDAGDERFDV